MNVPSEIRTQEFKKILDLLRRLEARVARIEDYLGISSGIESELVESVKASEKVSWEIKIGEYWLAHLGTAVFLLGLAFFISYPFKAISPVLINLFGYLAVIGLLGLSRFWQKTYQYLAKILFGSGIVLLYFTTLRLHFFRDNPIIASKAVGLAVVVTVLALSLYLAVKRRSEILTGITLFLAYSTSLISQTTHFALILVTVTSAAAVLILIRYNWHTLAVFSMIFTYLTHLIWLLNNPLLGNPMQAISEHHNNLIYLFLYGALFGGANLFRNRTSYSDISEFVLTFINSIGFFVVSSLVTVTFFKSELGLTNLLMAIFFLTVATLNWIHHQSRYSTSLYASFGYMALSIAIFTQFKSPDYFVWLGWESLLVISTAIWFRSRIIIVVNILIYLVIFLAYLRLAPSHDLVNLSYAVVALSSARILNWQKERLELKTDMIRNAYLASAFVIVLYGLHHAVPSNYVSLSWLGAALFYFGMSLALRNIKYRWMAISTIFATIIHVFILDMARLEAAFRIVLFLAVGIVLLVVSLLYAKHRKRFFS
jgi:hypothetical protein